MFLTPISPNRNVMIASRKKIQERKRAENRVRDSEMLIKFIHFYMNHSSFKKIMSQAHENVFNIHYLLKEISDYLGPMGRRYDRLHYKNIINNNRYSVILKNKNHPNRDSDRRVWTVLRETEFHLQVYR